LSIFTTSGRFEADAPSSGLPLSGQQFVHAPEGSMVGCGVGAMLEAAVAAELEDGGAWNRTASPLHAVATTAATSAAPIQRASPLPLNTVKVKPGQAEFVPKFTKRVTWVTGIWVNVGQR
jgi:hypothetical protein